MIHGPATSGGSGPDRYAWGEPGTETIVTGVHRIPLPLPMDGLRAVNVYAIEDGDGLVLVDGGWALDVSREVLERSLAEIGYGLSDIRQVLVTHMHRDHYTQAVSIRRVVGAEVGLGVGEQSSLKELMQGLPGIFPSQPARLRRLGATALADELAAVPASVSDTLAFYEDPDVWLEPGRIELQTLTLDAVHTPGHTRGHLVFHDAARRLLFAGDHVLPNITPSIGFEPDRPQFPLRDYLDSLAKVLALPDALLLPAHGPAGGSTHARATALVAHHERRLADTLGSLRSGAAFAVEVAEILRWTSRDRALHELGLFDRMLAVLEAAAHLDVLVLRGDAVRSDDGITTYGLPG